jgi:hypothetical protein
MARLKLPAAAMSAEQEMCMPMAFSLYPLRVPLVLLAILASSSLVYWALVRRWTTQRHWLAMSDWAESHGLTLRRDAKALLPRDAMNLADPPPRAVLSLSDRTTDIVQILIPKGPSKATQDRPMRWNLLVRALQTPWPTTGLRPRGRPHSLLDYLPLENMQAMSPSERFTLYGEQSAAARALGGSSAGALLPPDVGMLLIGQSLILDFSTRPFDPLEFQRMDALARQLAAHLPVRA